MPASQPASRNVLVRGLLLLSRTSCCASLCAPIQIVRPHITSTLWTPQRTWIFVPRSIFVCFLCLVGQLKICLAAMNQVKQHAIWFFIRAHGARVCVLCLLRSNWPLLLFIACHFMLFCFVLLSDFILVRTLSVCSVPIFCSASLGFLCLFTCCWWWQSTVGGPKTQFSRCWMFVSGAGGEDGSDTRSDNQQWMDFWPNNKTYKMVMQLSGIVRIQKPCSLRLAGGTKLAATKMLLEISP